MRRYLLIVILLALCLPGWASPAALPDFQLLDTAGRAHTLHRYRDASAVVLMAVPREDAALSERLGAFSALAEAQAAAKVFCFAVTTGAGPEAAGKVPVLVDDAQVVLPALGLSRAFEVVAAGSSDWKPFYRGDLEGLAAALGRFTQGDTSPTLNVPTGAPLALASAPDSISYSHDIAPILSARCVACHSEGNIGPFAIDSHKAVKGHAGMIREVVLGGRMPPWNADPRYGEFSNAMGLTAPEKQKLLAWLDRGAKMDGDADPLTSISAKPATKWRLGEPDLVVKLPEPQEIPAEGTLEYKYYDVALALPAGTWLRGTEVRVTAPEVMHHVLVYMHRPGEHFDFTQEYIASYVPGHDPGFFPEGTGKPVPEGAMLLFQLHYTPNGKATTDTPELGLYLHKTPPAHEIFLGSGVDRDFTIPPNATDAQTEAVFRADDDLLVYSLAPHMHFRGKRMSFEACYPDGSREMLLSVPQYDFYWQHSYHLATPKRIPRGTAIRVVGAWDNSVRNPLNPDPSQTLYWGDQSDEEMFIGSILYRKADKSAS